MLSILLLASVGAKVMYYSGRPVSGMSGGQSLPQPLTSLFFDFDGTIETGDRLAHEVFARSGRWSNTTGKDLIAAYKQIIADTNATYFQQYYFGGPERITQLQAAFKALRNATGSKVHILTASCNPVPADAWADYVYDLNCFLEFGFSRQAVVGVADTAGTAPADKGGVLRDYLEDKYHMTPVGAVHVDNSYKYIDGVLAVEADFVHVETKTGVVQSTLEQLVLKASKHGFDDLQSATPEVQQKVSNKKTNILRRGTNQQLIKDFTAVGAG